MNSTHAHFNISAREIGAKLKLHGSACPPFWILTVVWFWWRHRFQIASFSPSTLENSVFKKHRFQIAPLWRAFSNGSVFGDRFRRCSVDDSRIRSKTAPFSFENGLEWTGPLYWRKTAFGQSIWYASDQITTRLRFLTALNTSSWKVFWSKGDSSHFENLHPFKYPGSAVMSSK